MCDACRRRYMTCNIRRWCYNGLLYCSSPVPTALHTAVLDRVITTVQNTKDTAMQGLPCNPGGVLKALRSSPCAHQPPS